ncbi:hypothetical protein CALCODRAFT_541327 [Calocera cornea HHB12733]|uniref:Uncharacterized protein n=1 Tax=Calocera cornea HHB12733 TaxID=1353952 RepID=A0A165G545_9BASI|nr:hypothetical protein CALCODRAFT_541327 [Calocera cornea HHB12733]
MRLLQSIDPALESLPIFRPPGQRPRLSTGIQERSRLPGPALAYANDLGATGKENSVSQHLDDHETNRHPTISQPSFQRESTAQDDWKTPGRGSGWNSEMDEELNANIDANATGSPTALEATWGRIKRPSKRSKKTSSGDDSASISGTPAPEILANTTKTASSLSSNTAEDENGLPHLIQPRKWAVYTLKAYTDAFQKRAERGKAYCRLFISQLSQLSFPSTETRDTVARKAVAATNAEAKDDEPLLDMVLYPYLFSLFEDNMRWLYTKGREKTMLLVPKHWPELNNPDPTLVKGLAERLLSKANFLQEMTDPADIHHAIEHYLTGARLAFPIKHNVERARHDQYMELFEKFQKKEPISYMRLIRDVRLMCRDPNSVQEAAMAMTGRRVAAADDADVDFGSSGQDEFTRPTRDASGDQGIHVSVSTTTIMSVVNKLQRTWELRAFSYALSNSTNSTGGHWVKALNHLHLTFTRSISSTVIACTLKVSESAIFEDPGLVTLDLATYATMPAVNNLPPLKVFQKDCVLAVFHLSIPIAAPVPTASPPQDYYSLTILMKHNSDALDLRDCLKMNAALRPPFPMPGRFQAAFQVPGVGTGIETESATNSATHQIIDNIARQGQQSGSVSSDTVVATGQQETSIYALSPLALERYLAQVVREPGFQDLVGSTVNYSERLIELSKVETLQRMGAHQG